MLKIKRKLASFVLAGIMALSLSGMASAETADLLDEVDTHDHTTEFVDIISGLAISPLMICTNGHSATSSTDMFYDIW